MIKRLKEMCIYIRYSLSIIEKVFHYEENEISVIKINGDIWFKARDVSLALGYVNVCKSRSDHVDPEDRRALGQLQKGVTKRNPLFHKNELESTIFLNEAGLYSLVLQSKLPFAREFKRWIVKDVSPSIRKSGNYCLSNAKQCFSRQLCYNLNPLNHFTKTRPQTESHLEDLLKNHERIQIH